MGLVMSDPAGSGDPEDRDGANIGEGGVSDADVPVHCVVSQGGPYDDDSFIAGYQVGRVDAALWAARRACRPHVTVHHVLADVVEQLDLVAMHVGYVITRVDSEDNRVVDPDGELRTVIFTRSANPWDKTG